METRGLNLGKVQVGSLGLAKDATSFSADRLVSLAGGADDTWANTEDVTEEDFVLRSVRGHRG